MTTDTIEYQGSVPVPATIGDRYGLLPNMPTRIAESRVGVLLGPLTNEPPSVGLAAELEAWQMAGADVWSGFEYAEGL